MRATIRPSATQVKRFLRCFRNCVNRKPVRNPAANASDSRAWTRVLDRLATLEIETPSWGYGNSGTRFHVFPGRARRATRGSGSTTRRSCTGSPGAARRSRCTSRGTASTTGPRSAPCRGARDPDRRDQPEPLRRGRVQARLVLPPRRGGAREGARPLPRVRRDRAGSSARRRSASGSPTARTTRARTTSRARHARLADGLEQLYAAAAAGDEAARRVQVLRAGLLLDRPARLGHVGADVPPARPAGAGAGRHRPPPAGNEHRADRRDAAGRGAARRLPLQQPQVRRRRPDRRARSTPSSCSGSRARSCARPTRRRSR